MENKKVYIKVFGCQMNFYDEIRIESLMQNAGYTRTDIVAKADEIILITCSIREKAAEKVFSELGRMKKTIERSGQNIKDKIFAVVGCVAKQEGKVFFKRAPFTSIILSSRQYHKLPELIAQAKLDMAENGKSRILDIGTEGGEKFDMLPQVSTSDAAAFVTIQEGCDKFCSYCVVPGTRGAETSRPVKSVLNEVQNLYDLGAIEINLLGQNVDAYHGKDENGIEQNLSYIIKKIAAMPNIKRIRYTTSYPNELDKELPALHATEPKLMPFIYLPIQSGSDTVLNNMKRRYSVESYKKILKNIKELNPNVQISSDFIVGFPGETDDDFQATINIVREMKFIQSYCFKYSPRPNTPAEKMENQIENKIKDERLNLLQNELMINQIEFNQSCVETEMKVLFETVGKLTQTWIGKSEYMQPVLVKSKEDLKGQIRTVKIQSAGKILHGVLTDAD